MANIKSAKKRAKQTEKKRLKNLTRATAVKTTLKKLHKALEANEPQEKITVLFNETQATMARAKGKGLIHRNAVARRISRLAKKVAASKPKA